MNFLDIRIQELMDETDAHLLRSSQPHGWLGLIRSLRQGRLAWMFWVVWLAQLALFVIGIWAAVQFFQATEVLSAVKYGISAATLLLVALQIKLSIAPHMQTERLLRELKRVEILILAQNHKR